MKLYTEKQIREALNDNFNFGDRAIDFALSKLTPIELPSDEYIDEVFQPMTELNGFYKDGFINGAKWVIEQIKQQENGN